MITYTVYGSSATKKESEGNYSLITFTALKMTTNELKRFTLNKFKVNLISYTSN